MSKALAREPDLRDPAQFERAYREHQRRAFAAAVRVLRDDVAAEDVVQEVFTQLWRRPGAYDPRRGPLSTYVSLLARSRARDYWRTLSARGAAEDRLGRFEHAGARTIENEADAVALRDQARSALEALMALPHDQRDAVLLAHVGGLTAEQIARRSTVPVGTAKSRIRLGLAKARVALEAA